MQRSINIIAIFVFLFLFGFATLSEADEQGAQKGTEGSKFVIPSSLKGHLVPGIPKWGKGASSEKLITSPNGNKYWVPKNATKAQLKDAATIMKMEEGLYAVQSAEECKQYFASGNRHLHWDTQAREGEGGWGIYRGLDAMLAAYAVYFKEVKSIEVTLDETHIDVDRNMGFAATIQTLLAPLAKDGSYWLYTYRQTDIFRKFNGKWLIYNSHISVPAWGEDGSGDMTMIRQRQYYGKSNCN